VTQFAGEVRPSYSNPDINQNKTQFVHKVRPSYSNPDIDQNKPMLMKLDHFPDKNTNQIYIKIRLSTYSNPSKLNFSTHLQNYNYQDAVEERRYSIF